MMSNMNTQRHIQHYDTEMRLLKEYKSILNDTLNALEREARDLDAMDIDPLTRNDYWEV